MTDTHTRRDFQQKLWKAYDRYGRDLPWRQPEPDGTYDAYKILVSEFMLQQTQVGRVIPKYFDFLQRFPDMQSLAQAQLGDVLLQWSGLGYNRRAKYLREAVQSLSSVTKPWTFADLVRRKGIGENTAAAVIVYSRNEPLPFIETNIRTVYIHHFFAQHDQVRDTQIINVLKETMDKDNPREFYWALMDYGTQLKKQGIRNTRRSKHYQKQASFIGSRRQIRGEILRQITQRKQLTTADLAEIIVDDRRDEILEDLQREGFITIDAQRVHVT